MWLGCPAILHASLTRARAAKENQGFLSCVPAQLSSDGPGVEEVRRPHFTDVCVEVQNSESLPTSPGSEWQG